ncbi:hypothetical protein SAMN05216404_106145 [Nitrosospira multiformis]|uniref:Lipoprotein n=1 Tax=Nitrosospira multiformis TaxID=1231 RepID=A0A1H8IP12_9PROT|nr:hypothetical protein [Nitrosospira multiformis]SEN70690.1 hypothetical protein SAMN05216404_106145 [Nitrosospira multiformis]
MKKIAIVSAVIIMSGCAASKPINFTHPTASQSQYLADAKGCEYEATKHTQTVDPRYGDLYGALDMHERRRNLAVMCMEAKGYAVAKE